jgi:hypothetical protein
MGTEWGRKGRSTALIVGSFIAASLCAQPTDGIDQVQAVVHGLRTPQQALHVDQMIHAVDGVLVSRTDFASRNLFILLRSDSALDPEALRTMLAPSGIRLSCWSRRPRSQQPFEPLDPSACEPGPSPK